MNIAAMTPQREREVLQQRILAFLQSEIQDKTVTLRMEMPLEDVAVDSVDIMHVLFKVEEEFKIQIELAPNNRFSTVGDIVNTLIDLIPPRQ